MTQNHQFFLGRQPIVGRKRDLVAYELLFRASAENTAMVRDDVAASAAAIQHAFCDLGIEAALGGKLGFINLSEGLLMSDTIEMLPKERVVLEILETVRIAPHIIARCRDLRAAGYRLALDDVTAPFAAQDQMLPLMNIVKLDVLGMAQPRIAELAGWLRPLGVTLLAEKIETAAQYDTCMELGFELFQGYFFAKPVVLSGRAMQPSVMVLLKLCSLIAAEADTGVLEDAFKRAPDLTMRLLHLANSAGLRPAHKIASLRNAITVLGRVQLSRLLQLMIFSQQSGTDPSSDPLLQTAVTRGRLMESLAEVLGPAEIVPRAFMTGMLSLAGALFGQELHELAARLNLDEAIHRALLSRAGPLGHLLALVEDAEGGDTARIMNRLAALGLPDLDQFNRMQIAALSWAGSL